MNDNTQNNQESKTYGIMLSEVEGIIREISSEELDLDGMVKKVEKGYDLIKAMRERLADAKSKVEKLQVNFSELQIDKPKEAKAPEELPF